MIKDSVFTIVVNIFQSVATIIISIFIIKRFGKDLKGEYDFFVTNIALITTFICMSLPSGITFIVSKYNLKKVKFVNLTLLLAFCQTLLVYTGYIILSEFFSIPIVLNKNIHYLLYAGSIFLVLFNQYIKAFFLGLQKFKFINTNDLIRISSFFFLVSIIGYYFKSHFTITFLMTTYFVSFLLSSIFLLKNLENSKNKKSVSTNILINGIFNFSILSYLGTLFQFLNYRLDTYFIFYILGKAALAEYALVASIAEGIRLLPGAIATIILPKVASMENNNYDFTNITIASRIVFTFSLFGGFIICLLSIYFFPIFFNQDFSKTPIVLSILMVGLSFFSINTILASYFAGAGKVHYNLTIAFLALIITVVLDYFLIPSMGILGAAVASSVSYISSTVMVMIIFKNKYGVAYFELLFIKINDVILLKKRLISFLN